MDQNEREERIEELKRLEQRDRSISTISYILSVVGLAVFVLSFAFGDDLDLTYQDEITVGGICAGVIFLVLALVMGSRSKAAERAADNMTELDPMERKVSRLNKTLEEIFLPDMTLLEESQVFSECIDEVHEKIGSGMLANDLEAIKLYVQDIFKLAAHDAAYKQQVGRFSRIYLPETLKLISAYLELTERNVQTEETELMKQEIAGTLSDVRNAFANMNRKLINQADNDIQAEIETFKTLLTIDGALRERDIMQTQAMLSDGEEEEIKDESE